MDIVWAGPSDAEINKGLADWAAAIIEPTRPISLTPCTCMAVLLGQTILAVVAWNNWDPHSRTMEMNGAAVSRRWMTKRSINSMFSYPFNEVGCQMVIARVSERNKTTLKILKSLGFDQVTIPRLRGETEGEVICTMTTESWSQSKFYEERLNV